MNFSQLHERLRTELRRRIDEGTLTGALIARRTGLAQAHVSKFLSGKTNLGKDAADLMLDKLGMTVEGLLSGKSAPPAQSDPSATAFPVFEADDLADVDFLTPRGSILLPAEVFRPAPSLARRPARIRWAALTLTAAHVDPMRPAIEKGDVVLVDRHGTTPGAAGERREALPVYALQLTPGATLFRHVIADRGRGLFLLQPANSSFPAQAIPYARSGSNETPVLGRVVGIVRTELFRLL